MKLPKVVYYMDDILVTAYNDEEHFQNLTAVLGIMESKPSFPSANFSKSLSNILCGGKEGIHTSKKSQNNHKYLLPNTCFQTAMIP